MRDANYGMQVITSFHPEDADDHLLVIASTTQPQEEGMPSKLRLQIPRSKAYFTGTGSRLDSTNLRPRSIRVLVSGSGIVDLS